MSAIIYRTGRLPPNPQASHEMTILGEEARHRCAVREAIKAICMHACVSQMDSRPHAPIPGALNCFCAVAKRPLFCAATLRSIS